MVSMANTIRLDGAAGCCYGDCLEASVWEGETKPKKDEKIRRSGGAGSESASGVQSREPGGKGFVGSE